MSFGNVIWIALAIIFGFLAAYTFLDRICICVERCAHGRNKHDEYLKGDSNDESEG